MAFRGHHLQVTTERNFFVHISDKRQAVTQNRRKSRFGFSFKAQDYKACHIGEEGYKNFPEALRGHERALDGGLLDRRSALTLLILTISESLQHRKAMAFDEVAKGMLDLESYVDETEGFMVLKPVQWKKIEKAGATVLFEDPQSKANNVGVVVNPVRISSLREFGTADVVADRLLQAEKKKPSTNDVQLIKVNERQVYGGAPLYQLEYKLDSSRGFKRILSAVTVASKKLYILNVAYADGPEKPLSSDTAAVLEQIVNSFDILN